MAANDAFCQITGHPRDEVLGSTSIELGIWDDPADRDRLTDAILEHGSVTGIEVRGVTRHGDLRDAEVSGQVVEISGQPLLLIAVRDVTRRKLAERERDRLLAREHEARMRAEAVYAQLETLVSAAPVGHRAGRPPTAVPAHQPRAGGRRARPPPRAEAVPGRRAGQPAGDGQRRADGAAGHLAGIVLAGGARGGRRARHRRRRRGHHRAEARRDQAARERGADAARARPAAARRGGRARADRDRPARRHDPGDGGDALLARPCAARCGGAARGHGRPDPRRPGDARGRHRTRAWAGIRAAAAAAGGTGPRRSGTRAGRLPRVRGRFRLQGDGDGQALPRGDRDAGLPLHRGGAGQRRQARTGGDRQRAHRLPARPADDRGAGRRARVPRRPAAPPLPARSSISGWGCSRSGCGWPTGTSRSRRRPERARGWPSRCRRRSAACKGAAADPAISCM